MKERKEIPNQQFFLTIWLKLDCEKWGMRLHFRSRDRKIMYFKGRKNCIAETYIIKITVTYLVLNSNHQDLVSLRGQTQQA